MIGNMLFKNANRGSVLLPGLDDYEDSHVVHTEYFPNPSIYIRPVSFIALDGIHLVSSQYTRPLHNHTYVTTFPFTIAATLPYWEGDNEKLLLNNS